MRLDLDISGPAAQSLTGAAVALLDALGARWSYTASFVLLALALPLLTVVAWRWLWPALGQPVSRWVARKRRNPSSEETTRLVAVRNTLGTLAHDVLKHRLLGLVSLVQSLDALEKETAPSPAAKTGARRRDGEVSVATTHPDQWEALRAELLRLCGARAAPNERLWARWTDAFAEVRRITGARIAPPWADSSLRRTDRTLRKLRRMVRAFVAGERESAISPERIRKLELARIGDVHGAVLRLSEGCRPLVEPRPIVDEALSAVSALTGRKGARSRVQCVLDAQGEFLANAPARLLVTALERLLDNALRLSPPDAPLAVHVDLEHDELFGDEVLILRVLDCIDKVPAPEQYGTGLRDVHRELADFECGLAFARVELDDALRSRLGPGCERFVKEARVTVPVIAAEPLDTSHRARLPLFGTLIGVGALALLAVGSTSRILGGAPVQFAGGGEPVVEFRVEVGEELSFALCEGGRDPQAELELEHNGCQGRGCSIEQAVAALVPCTDGLSRGDCPGAFRWTPRFVDGSRQGTNYELSMVCRAPGPPRSEDVRRIRLVVSRPNSTPTLRSLQLADTASERIIEVSPERELVVPAGGQFVLTALAVDDDDDLLVFSLEPETLGDDEDGGGAGTAESRSEPMESIEGRFRLGELDWSADGRWQATIRVTDGVSPPVEQRISFRAGTLRPLRLDALSLSRVDPASGDEERLRCNTGTNSRLCEILESTRYAAEVDVWFDPLLGHVNERLSLSTDEDAAIVVRPAGRASTQGGTPQADQRWEVFERFDNRLLATLRLVEVPPDTAAGLRRYRFLIDVEQLASTDPSVWTLKLGFSEPSSRTEPLEATLALARSDEHPALWASPASMTVSEYERDGDRRKGRAVVQLFHTEPGIELADPQLVCDPSELADAFEEVRIERNADGSLQLSAALRQGCIDGLGGSTSRFGNARCRIDLATVDGRHRVSVRVGVKDQACVPTITRLEPEAEGEVLEGEEIVYRVEVRDPDGDLKPSDVKLSGLGDWSIDLKQAPDALGSAIFGTLRGRPQCGDLRRPIAVEATDGRGHLTAQRLEIDMQCKPLVHTLDGVTSFVVDEGQRVDVQLMTNVGARLIVDGPIGELEHGQGYDRFVWDADCRRGRGPFLVGVRGEHRELYGDPLELSIEVRRCRVGLGLEEGGTTVALDKPFAMEVARPQKLRIQPELARVQDLEFTVATADGDTSRRDIVVDSFESQGEPDFLQIRCREPGERDIIVLAEPVGAARNAWMDSRPLKLRVVCLPKGSLERAARDEDDSGGQAE